MYKARHRLESPMDFLYIIYLWSPLTICLGFTKGQKLCRKPPKYIQTKLVLFRLKRNGPAKEMTQGQCVALSLKQDACDIKSETRCMWH